MEVFNVGDAKTQLSKLIEMALDGQEVIIGRRNHPLVRLAPLVTPGETGKRVGGYLRGQIHIADDFDAPDEDLIDLFEGDGSEISD
jgi:antitoxin (DNA-binding transcriptional repressor) of toxin-antitoxin stability system